MRSRLLHLVRAYAWELGLSVLLFAAALAVRLPNLLMVPRYTDEALEVLFALDIAAGRILPLTAVDPYDGPFFPYLLAVLSRLFGVSVALPRLTVMVLSALTVPVTYWLGRAMWNRRAGLIASAFVITSPSLILITSHQAFSSALTPFFSTLAAAALYLGVSRRKDWLLALSGLLAALTLQTHPLAVVALVGMLLWFLFRRDLGVWLRRRAPYYALGLFFLGYAPMLVANLEPDSPMFVQAEKRAYAFAPTLSPEAYLQRLAGLVQRILTIIGGGLGLDPLPFWPGVLVMGLLLLAGLLLAWRRGNGLIPAIFLSTVLLLPIIVKSFVQSDVGDRYIMFLAPLGFVLIGGLLVAGLDTLGTVRAGAGISRSTWHKAGALLVLSAVVALIAYPIRTLGVIYDSAFATGQTNQEFFRLLEVTQANEACGHGLFVQDLITFKQDRVEAWYTVKTIHYLLTLDRCRHASQTSDRIVTGLHARDDDGWIIIAETSLTTYSGMFDLVPVTTIAAYPDAQPGPYVLYRVRPKPLPRAYAGG